MDSRRCRVFIEYSLAHAVGIEETYSVYRMNEDGQAQAQVQRSGYARAHGEFDKFAVIALSTIIFFHC